MICCLETLSSNPPIAIRDSFQLLTNGPCRETHHMISLIFFVHSSELYVFVSYQISISLGKKSTCFTNQNSSVIIQGMSSLEFTMIPDILMLQSPTLLTQWHFCCPLGSQSFSFCFAGRRRSSCADAADSHGGEPAVPLFF